MLKDTPTSDTACSPRCRLARDTEVPAAVPPDHGAAVSPQAFFVLFLFYVYLFLNLEGSLNIFLFSDVRHVYTILNTTIVLETKILLVETHVTL